MSDPVTDQPIRDAATIILVRRDGHAPAVLMGQRGAGAAFMPSKYVFPGGAVDAGDADIRLAAPLASRCSARLKGARVTPETLAIAAIRELWEETGLALGRPGNWDDPPSDWRGFADQGLVPDASALRFVFRAITPAGRPRRFDARFFLADAAAIATDPDDFSRACDELSHLHWVPLSEARALNLPFITEVVLAETTDLIHAAGAGPLASPETVPFFDNTTAETRFLHLK